MIELPKLLAGRDHLGNIWVARLEKPRIVGCVVRLDKDGTLPREKSGDPDKGFVTAFEPEAGLALSYVHIDETEWVTGETVAEMIRFANRPPL